MGQDNDNGVVEFQFSSPSNKTKWESIKSAIYDPGTKQILGRTGKNWGQLLMFYAIFYAVLAALFAICMQGLFATLDEKEPRWKLESSLIGTNPGLGFRPISSRTEEGSLIWYNATNATTIEKWVKLIDEFLEPYNQSQMGENYDNCDFDKLPKEGKVCSTNVADFQLCNRNESYGFRESSPCIFLKLNKIYGWQPEFITEPQEDMPEDLRRYISQLEPSNRKQIWVTCKGEDPVDDENVKEFKYYPRGFAGYYYPYTNVKNYKSPIIAVQVVQPTPNQIISIECRAWAKNIIYQNSSLNRAGSVTFQLQIDTANDTKLTPKI